MLACHDGAEPEPLNIKGEMPHKTQARPSRRQDRAPQGFFRKAFQYPEHVGALIVQGREKCPALIARFRLSHGSSLIR